MLEARIGIVPYMHNLEIVEASYIDHEFPRHLHETFVIEVVVEGNVAFECSGKSYLAPKGGIILLHPEVVHTGRSADRKAVSYRSFHPTTEWMKWISKQLNYDREIAFKSVTLENPPVARLLKKAHKAFQNDQDPLDAESLMTLAFSMLVRSQTDVSPATSFNAPQSILRAKEYLEGEYSRSVQLSELANVSGLSPFYFLRAFTKATGLTPHEYLCNLRVEKARKLLSGGVSIAETAAETGFFDQSHLHRHFLRILGITPGKYRAILSNKKTIPAV
jgi:AraC-like DNA-binding protein